MNPKKWVEVWHFNAILTHFYAKYFESLKTFSAKTYALRVEHSDERQRRNMHQGESGLKYNPFYSYI